MAQDGTPRFSASHLGLSSLPMSKKDEARLIWVDPFQNEVFAWSLLKRFTKETDQDMHTGPITCVAMTSDGKRVISGKV